MIKIKLSRTGRKNAPKYRIVVMEEHSKRDGEYIDEIGIYDPVADPYVLEVSDAKLHSWLQKGAQLTDGTYKLLKKRIKRHE